MYKIIKAEKLNEIVYLMVVEAPMVAKHCQPGQFIIVKEDDAGERIPLTICDYDREAGTVTIVFQPIGASTEKFAKLQAGDVFEDFVGPLGCPSEFVNEDPEELKKEKILFVAGGVGTAPVYPQVKWLHEHGIDADVIVGAKTKDLIILEKEMEAVAGNLYITTDDGYGNKSNRRSDRRRKNIYKMCIHRTYDHDEILLPDHSEIQHSYYRIHEPDHGRRYRYVRSLSCHRW